MTRLRLAGLLVLLVGLEGCGGGRDEPRLRTLPATQAFAAMPRANVRIDLSAERGSLQTFRHTVGIGGINPSPLSPRVIGGTKKLRPRLIRVFIQEFFTIYPEHGRLDWSKLDPYMDALAKTDAKVVAAITIKPRPLYPTVDASVWRPNDLQEWQRVVVALVKRYSVDRKLVTYWEIGNEPDIGEDGGCPYLITNVADYFEYYKLTAQAVLGAFPDAKVGGPAVATTGGKYLPEFVRLCREQKVRLDFVSWHLYADDAAAHARLVERYAKLAAGFADKPPEMLITEWSKGFEPASVEEQAFEPRRAAMIAAGIMAMTDAGPAWTFYYHLNDQFARWDDFQPFMHDPNLLYHHWNEVPHRFGLFGVGGEVRPQYFVYQMLARMPGTRIAAHCDQGDLHALAAKDPGRVAVLLSNYALPASRDQIATLRFTGLTPGRKRLIIFRIDGAQAWSSKRLELIPIETREVDARGEFSFQTYCPADSVTLAVLEDL